MNLPELPRNSSRTEMRKALIRLRMEMHRQEIRHESGQLLQPLQRVRGMTQNLQDGFGIKHAPLWGVAAVTWSCKAPRANSSGHAVVCTQQKHAG